LATPNRKGVQALHIVQENLRTPLTPEDYADALACNEVLHSLGA
jgi:hypothetical protein